MQQIVKRERNVHAYLSGLRLVLPSHPVKPQLLQPASLIIFLYKDRHRTTPKNIHTQVEGGWTDDSPWKWEVK